MSTATIIISISSFFVLVVIATVLALYFTKTFPFEEPAVDCIVSDFSSCDAATGIKTRTILTDSQGSGLACPELTSNCPVDCIAGAWSVCVDGKQTRTVDKQAINGGKDCVLEQKCAIPFNSMTELSTVPQDYDGLIYFDRHPKLCPENPINSYKFSKEGNQGKFDYKCSEKISGADKTNKLTPAIETKNIESLAKIDISCADNEVISNFGLNRPVDGLYKFGYTCLKSDEPLKCRQVETSPSNSIYEHSVACNSDEVISKVNVKNNPGNLVQFVYDCCKKITA